MLNSNAGAKVKQGLLTSLQNNTDPVTLLPSLLMGIVIWLIALLIGASFSALIFQGRLAAYLASGMGMFLISAIILHVLTALFSSDAAAIPSPQSTTAVIMGAVGANLVGMAPADISDETLFLTVIATILLSSFLTGLFLLAVGGLRLANLIRYSPYPVIGGFIAGTGWLLVQGSMQVMLGLQLRLDSLTLVLGPEQVIRWLPGLVMTLVLLVLLRRTNNILAFPAVFITALVLFYAILHFSGAVNDPLWFLSAVAEDIDRPRLDLAALQKIDVPLVLAQAAGIAALIIFSTMNLLLNVSGQELIGNKELDFNRELAVAGAGNIFSSLFGGGIVGFTSLVYTALVHRSGANGRLINLALAVLLACTLLFGASFVVLFPRAILGGVLMYFGCSFLVDWLYDAYFKMPKLDYLIVVVILLVIAAFGLLWGVAVGIFVSIVLFALKYSQIIVIRQEMSGHVYRSTTDRSHAENILLRELGGRVLVFRLQGYIFFGTGFQLHHRIRERILSYQAGDLQFIILDFRLTSGMDISTVVEFSKLRQVARQRGIELLLASVSPPVLAVLQSSLFLTSEIRPSILFDDLDHAMQWCEDQLLAQGNLDNVTSVTIEEHLSPHPMIRPLEIDNLLKYLERIEAPVGAYIAHQGDESDSLFVIESGRVDILLDLEYDHVTRLRSMCAGAIFGELGFYLGAPRSASVLVTEAVVLLKLSRDALRQMEEYDPHAAIAFHAFVTSVLSHRLIATNRIVEALSD